MHPTKTELISFAAGKSSDLSRHQEIADHIEKCEFCSEFIEDIRAADSRNNDPVPAKLGDLAERIYRSAVQSQVIRLAPLTVDIDVGEASYLAADGVSDEESRVHSLATFCSESPEVILRIMSDPGRGTDYLQVMADDRKLTDHVMVVAPELGLEYVTDGTGRADISLSPTERVDEIRWQIKMPEAVFELEPLKYDPERLEYTGEISLETERHDVIEVKFEGRTGGKRLSFKILELEGDPDFGPVKVSIKQEDKHELGSVYPGEEIEFGLIDSRSTIQIKLYQ